MAEDGVVDVFQPATLRAACLRCIVSRLHLFSALHDLPPSLADELLKLIKTHLQARNGPLTEDGLDAFLELAAQRAAAAVGGGSDGSGAELPAGSQLRTLNLQWSPALTTLEALPRWGRQLTQLDVSYCESLSTAGVITIANSCPALQLLNLTGCKAVRDAGCQAVAARCPALADLSVDLCGRLTDVAVQSLMRARHGTLRRLTVDNLRRLSSVGLQIIASHGAALVSLSIGGCAVTDYEVKDIEKHCDALQELSLRACRLCGDRSAIALARLSRRKSEAGLPPLRRLDLAGCATLGDKGVKAISVRCRQLQRLDLSGTAVTDAGLSLLTAIKTLRVVTVKHCDALSKSAITSLLSAFPPMALQVRS